MPLKGMFPVKIYEGIARVSGPTKTLGIKDELTKKATHAKLNTSVLHDRDTPSSINNSGAIQRARPASLSDVELRAARPGSSSTALLRPKSMILGLPSRSMRTLS